MLLFSIERALLPLVVDRKAFASSVRLMMLPPLPIKCMPLASQNAPGTGLKGAKDKLVVNQSGLLGRSRKTSAIVVDEVYSTTDWTGPALLREARRSSQIGLRPGGHHSSARMPCPCNRVHLYALQNLHLRAKLRVAQWIQ
ncbi:hypothetical protein KC361_g280 [Hortaea werneckii]|nr:hypothetical protein KC361_g280 [Hortaea werneckii]